MIHATLMPRSTLVYEVPASGRIAHSLFMKVLFSSSKQLAKKVRKEKIKPFSVSRITTNKKRIQKHLAIVPPDDYVRVTFKLIDDVLLNPVLSGLESANLMINGVPVNVMDITVSNRDFWDILGEAPITRGFTLNLLTPALGIDKDFPPPAPTVLRRAFLSWNAYSNIKLPEAIFRRLFLAEPAIPTCLQSDAVPLTFRGNKAVQVGYRGAISYSLWRFWSQEGAIISALAKFAEYTGIGAKTSMGFGVTRTRFWKRH